MNVVETYLKDLGETYRTGGGQAEESYYTALANLLNEVGKKLKPRVRCVGQLKNVGVGMPDFGLFTANQFQRSKDTKPIPGQLPERGAIECKPWDDDSFAQTRSAQVSKYWKRYGVVLVTNYHDFVLVGRNEEGKAVRLESYRMASSENEFRAMLAHPRKTAQEQGERLEEFLRRNASCSAADRAGEFGVASAGNVTLSTGTQTKYVTTSNSTGNLKFKGTTTGLIQIEFDNISVEMVPDADVVYKYDYKGRRVKKVVTAAYGTANSTTTTFTYDGGQVETQTAIDGIVTKYEYYTTAEDPSYGRLWKTIFDYGNSNITTEYTYDEYGNIIEVEDPDGNITQNEYNNLDQLIETTAPEPFEYVTQFEYDNKGNRDKIIRVIGDAEDPDQTTEYIYNALNNLQRVVAADGNSTKYGYDDNEQIELIKDAEDNETERFYDERGLLIKITDANEGETEFEYDDNGNLVKIIDPEDAQTTFDYDDFDRLIKITYPDTKYEEFEYDKNSNITSKTTRAGAEITYDYDEMNRLREIDRPALDDVTLHYDTDGRLAQVIDARSSSEGGGTTGFDFDDLGRVDEVTDINSRVVGYQYDDMGRRTRLTYPDSSYITYEYDELSRLTGIKDDGGEYLAQYDYDELSRRTKVTIGNDSETQLPEYYDDATAEYEWDLGNRLKKVTNIPAICYENYWNPEIITFEYARYDKVGNRMSMKIDSDPSHVYEYDKLYQLYYVDYNDGNDIRYDYDDLGNRDDVNVSGGHTAYTANAMNQYTQVASKSFSYDDNGNLTDDGYTDYTYDYENRLLTSTCDTINPAHLGPNEVENGTFTGSASGWTLGSGGSGYWLYDDNHVEYGGYQTDADLEQSIDNLQAEKTYKITYDVLSHYTAGSPTQVNIELGGASAGTVTLSTGTQTRYVTTSNSTGNLKFKVDSGDTFQIGLDNISVEMVPDADVVCKYDYKGRRVKKVVTAAYGTASSTTTTFTYDGDQVIAEYDGEDSLLRKFVYGPSIDEPVCMIDATDNDKVYYYFFDGLGSVAALSDAVGNLVERYSYDVFGEVTVEGPDGAWLGQSDVNNPYMFTARRYDHESATYYYRAREYGPEIGRFLQPDPIRYNAGVNFYAYVGNNPGGRVDPYGLAACTQLGFGPYCQVSGPIWTWCTPWDQLVSVGPIGIIWYRYCEKDQKCKVYYLLCTICVCPPSASCQRVYTGAVETVMMDWWNEFKFSIINPNPSPWPPRPTPPPGW